MPRLKPRPSSSQPSGIENVFSVNVNNCDGRNTPALSTSSSPSSISASTGKKDSYKQESSTSSDDSLNSKGNPHLFTEVVSQHNGPLSPSRVNPQYDQPANSPVPDHYGKQHKHLLLSSSPSTSNSSASDISTKDYSDFSLTPPTAGSRPPLLVSAKRYGNEVRRQHTKCRRRRRRPLSTKSVSQSDDSWDAEHREYSEENDKNAFCLWKRYSPGEVEECLPLFASSDEEDEQTDRIEEVVRAEHLKEAMVAQGNKKLQLKIRSFSANRAPPPKGCLSNPRPKRPRGQTFRYKTPPKSSDELDVMSEAKAQETRRVQFGNPSAVEYEIDRPSGHLTPMSQEITRKRYSMNPKEPSEEENDITRETKQNNLILSEWEDQIGKMQSNRKRSSDRLRRNGSLSKRNRRNRRSSSIFSPASRISLVYDHSNTNSHGTIGEDGEFCAVASDSKEAMIATNSAAQSISRSKLSLDGDSSHTTSQTTSEASVSRSSNENPTWDFVADLRSIHSKGAMGLSPPTSSPATIGSGMSDTTKSRNSMLLSESIHSPADVKFDIENKINGKIGNGSPIHHRFFQNGSSSSDSPVSYSQQICENAPDKISKILITSPWFDQEWDFVSLLRNLSFFTKDEVMVERIFHLFDPCLRDAPSSLGDFIERIMHELLSKSTVQEVASDKACIHLAKSAITTEWKKIEISLVENMINMLHKFRSRMENIRRSMKKTKDCLDLCDRLTYFWSEKKTIENEISELENDVRELRTSLDVLEASTAPATCIHCQATAQIGVYGFNFEEFCDEQILILDYNHAIFDIKTRVIVDIDSQSGPSIEHDVMPSSKRHDPIFSFHQGYLNKLRRGDISLQLNDTELQDSLLRLAQILGRLDRCALALKAINEEQQSSTPIEVDLPHLRFTFPNHENKLLLTLDLECFVTEMISVCSRDESGLKSRTKEISSSVDCCDLKSLRRLLSKYA